MFMVAGWTIWRIRGFPPPSKGYPGSRNPTEPANWTVDQTQDSRGQVSSGCGPGPVSSESLVITASISYSQGNLGCSAGS